MILAGSIVVSMQLSQPYLDCQKILAAKFEVKNALQAASFPKSY